MPTRRTLSLAAGAFGLLAFSGCSLAQAPSTVGWPQPAQAKPSITYLNLLAKTPFFVGLSSEQLQWVIDHSREWSVPAGAEISSSALGPDNFWVLLDGGWQVEHGGKTAKAGHADAAKWYGGAAMNTLGKTSRLVATAASYVMNIRQADLDEMRRRGFPIEPQLQSGLAFYRSFFN